jgi:hypothetical protein
MKKQAHSVSSRTILALFQVLTLRYLSPLARVASREATTVASRPVLRISYDTVTMGAVSRAVTQVRCSRLVSWCAMLTFGNTDMHNYLQQQCLQQHRRRNILWPLQSLRIDR